MAQQDLIRMALFGAGRIGAVHAANIVAHPALELAYICDPHGSSARTLAASTRSKIAMSEDEIFADQAIDAVVIGSPTNTHINLIEKARQYGKAALCEKPIDLDSDRVRAFMDVSFGPGRPPLMLGFNRRFDPSMSTVRKRVAAGEIGRLEQLVITSRDPYPAPDDYVAASGGIFRDMTIHDLDMARSYVPNFTEVFATAANVFSDFIREVGDFDSVVVTLRGADGELVTIINSRHCAFGFDQRLEAFGSDGMLTVANIASTTVRSYTREYAGAGQTYLPFFLERYAASYAAELAAFVEAIQGIAPCRPDLNDGLRALELADAALESARTGHAIALDK